MSDETKFAQVPEELCCWTNKLRILQKKGEGKEGKEEKERVDKQHMTERRESKIRVLYLIASIHFCLES